MDSIDTDDIDWALPDLPFSQTSGISAKFSRELPLKVQGNQEWSDGASLALLTRFVRTLVTRKVPEVFFLRNHPYQPTYLGEGATYLVSKGRFGDADRSGAMGNKRLAVPVTRPTHAAFKTAKVRIPQSNTANLRPTIEEYRRLKSVLFEVEILSHPAIKSHPNIVSLRGHSWFGLTGSAVVPALALELAELGNARAFIANSRHATVEVKIAFCGDVVAGLEFLHACKITHGDVKLDNVLVFETEHRGTFVAKISDFERSPQNSDTLSYTGTTCYNAPEVHEANRSPRSTPIQPEHLWLCDVFSFGLLVLESFLDAKFYGNLQGGEELMACIVSGDSVGSRNILPLAQEVAHTELQCCPLLFKICCAVLGATLLHRPSDRLREGWIAIHRLLHSQSKIGTLPADVLQPLHEERQSSHSVLEIYSLPRVLHVRKSLGDGLLGPAVLSHLKEIATTSPSLQDRGRAAFGLFLCAHIDLLGNSPGQAETPETPLESLKASADAGYPAAFVIGQRVFEANHLKVPDVFLGGPQDEVLSKTLKQLADVADSDYYSTAVQTFWPPAIRDASRALLPALAAADGLFDMPTWIDDQSRVMGRELFKGHAEQDFFLHHAILRGNYASCERLVLLGCDINARMPGGITPLSLACRCAEVDIVRLLLESNADASLPDDKDALPLHWLVLLPAGDVSDWIVTQLADSCSHAGRAVDTASQAFFDDLGLATSGNALSWAIQCRNHNLVKALLRNGIIDPAAGPRSAKSYLRMAAATACAKTAECLLEHLKQREGCSSDGLDLVNNLFQFVGISTIDCSSDVHRWAMHGRSLDTSIRDFIDILERFGGCMDPAVSFHNACHFSLPLLRELVRRGVSINIQDRSNEDWPRTPLAAAIIRASGDSWGYRGCETVRYLLSLGAEMVDETPIELACNMPSSPALLAVLCAARPDDLEVCDINGFTPLIILVRRGGSLAAVKVLVQAGASVRAERRMMKHDQQDNGGGETALACAIVIFNWEIAEYLLEKGGVLEYGVMCGGRQTVLHLLVLETFLGMTNNTPGCIEQALFIARKLLAYDPERDLANEPDFHNLTPCELAIFLGLPVLLDAFVRGAPRGISSSALELGLAICADVTSIDKAPGMFEVDGEELVFVLPGMQGECRLLFRDYKKRLDGIQAVLEGIATPVLPRQPATTDSSDRPWRKYLQQISG
ncbi:hypothetical protein QBC44DRAFT_356573 [Cladorrhinum sp. PSN332]|nr:hypothetical protein QBC44DRAFT_356573 [Cladorrhinum sp. PSN332]